MRILRRQPEPPPVPLPLNGATAIAAELRNAMPSLPGGSFRFFGDWFGGRPDNHHQLVSIEATDHRLVLGFNGGETLEVEEPRGFQLRLKRRTLDFATITIEQARVVQWRWYYYGRPRTEPNLHFIRYEASRSTVTRSSNADLYKPRSDPSLAFPAIEMY